MTQQGISTVPVLLISLETGANRLLMIAKRFCA